jgi:hypothetical protein
MTALEVQQKEPEIVVSSSLDVKVVASNTAKSTIWTTLGELGITFGLALAQALSNPVNIEPDGKIHFRLSKMEDGRYYPFEHNGKEYLIKRHNKTVDVYEIKG